MNERITEPWIVSDNFPHSYKRDPSGFHLTLISNSQTLRRPDKTCSGPRFPALKSTFTPLSAAGFYLQSLEDLLLRNRTQL